MTNFDLLQIRSETFVAELDYHDEIESTNTRATERIQAGEIPGAGEPCLILADRQTAGRGRSSNRWWSSDGALTFTLVLPTPNQIVRSLPLASLAVGLAVCQAVESFAPDADLAVKWPNDVYGNGRKLSGILIEKPAGTALAIGVGINVNDRRETAPKEVRQRSISVCELIDHELDRTAILIRVLQEIETQFEQLAAASHQLLENWRRYDYLIGKQLELDAYGETHRGEYLGIDEQGALRLRTPRGEERFTGGVIGFV